MKFAPNFKFEKTPNKFNSSQKKLLCTNKRKMYWTRLLLYVPKLTKCHQLKIILNHFSIFCTWQKHEDNVFKKYIKVPVTNPILPFTTFGKKIINPKKLLVDTLPQHLIGNETWKLNHSCRPRNKKNYIRKYPRATNEKFSTFFSVQTSISLVKKVL